MLSQKLAYFTFRAFRKSRGLLDRSPLGWTRTMNLYGYELRFVAGSVVTHLPIQWHPQFDREHLVGYTDFVQMQSLMRELRDTSKPIIIDVGAYHGLYAVLLGRIAQEASGRVIALEPDPASFDVLRRNIAANGLDDTVICEQVAVGAERGTAELFSAKSRSRITTRNAESRSNIPRQTSVDVITLRDIADRHGIDHIHELIIDVEGLELPVLRGIPRDLAIDSIFCELHPYNWEEMGYSGEDLQEFLDDHDLVCLDAFLRPLRAPFGTKYLGPTRLLPRNSFGVSATNEIRDRRPQEICS